MENLPKKDKDEIIDQMINDQNVRRGIANKSLSWFTYCYFAHYIKCEMADFHHAMFNFAQDTSVQSAVVTAFRGSAKSTIFTLAFPIWSILGVHQIKHILILSGTQQKAQQMLDNIKRELETNKMLHDDLGPFKEEKTGWNTVSLYISKYDARIACGSVGQSIRSTRFKEYRPQLIILDDIEDLESVKTKESRDKIEDWLTGEVIPSGEQATRMFLVGNLLHNDSVMKRLQKRIEEGGMAAKFLRVPILDEEGKPTWPGKYPNQAAIEAEKLKGLSEIAWRREYMLEIIPDEDQIIHEDMIKRYKELPPFESYVEYRFANTGVDLAISQKETADYTAAVSVQIFGYGKERKIYVLPNPLNERLTSLKAVERVSAISHGLGNGMPTRVLVEDVGYQKAFIELLKEKDIPAEGVTVSGHDKRSRLMTTAPLIQSGAILFPYHGCEKLITQLVGFGVEKHDDLVDALTLIILKIIGEDNNYGRLLFPIDEKQPDPQTQKDAEHEADEEIILLQRAKKGDQVAARKHQELIQKKDKKYWDDEGRDACRRMMGGW